MSITILGLLILSSCEKETCEDMQGLPENYKRVAVCSVQCQGVTYNEYPFNVSYAPGHTDLYNPYYGELPTFKREEFYDHDTQESYTGIRITGHVMDVEKDYSTLYISVILREDTKKVVYSEIRVYYSETLSSNEILTFTIYEYDPPIGFTLLNFDEKAGKLSGSFTISNPIMTVGGSIETNVASGTFEIDVRETV